METGTVPITFEEQYLQDVVAKQEALIQSIADSISSAQNAAGPAGGHANDADQVRQEVRKTVDWLADRMSVGFTW